MSNARSRPTNIRGRSNMSKRCRRPKPASCGAMRCGRWRQTVPYRRALPRNENREGEQPVTAPKGPILTVVPHSETDTSPSGPVVLQPSGWPAPKGYAHGMAADGHLVVTGGVIGWDTEGLLAPDFVAQVRQTLRNIAEIIAEGGAKPEHL